MKRPKRDPMSVLMSIREKAWERQPGVLAAIPAEERAAFQRLFDILEQSKLMQFLDKTERTEHGERFVCVNEFLVSQQYPGQDPLAGGLTKIDAFIYAYDGITGPQVPRAQTRGDLRQYLGEAGFRRLLLALHRACKIHRSCGEHLRADRPVIEPITLKPTIEARKDAFALHAVAREVFQQIARKINDEMPAEDVDTPQVFKDAVAFAREMSAVLEPLAELAKRIRGGDRAKTG